MKLEEMSALVAVVDEGSFMAAAKALGVPRATLHRRVDALAARLGVPLLARAAHGVEPTAAGLALVDGGRQLLREAERLMSDAARVANLSSRPLRIALPYGVPDAMIVGGLALVRARIPEACFITTFFPGPPDQAPRGMDAVVHLGHGEPRSSWLSYHLADIPERLAASSRYLEAHGTPGSLGELDQHRLLTLYLPGEDPESLPLLDGGSLPVAPFLATSDPRTNAAAAMAGEGIALVPPPVTLGEAGRGLVAVLPQIVGRSRALCLSVPARLEHLSPLKELFLLLKPFVRRTVRPEDG